GGEEKAVHGGALSELNNPLRLRRPMDQGVRVIIAHCASLGENIDIDRGPNGPDADGFVLFERLMNEPPYQGRLYDDISAVTPANRTESGLYTLIKPWASTS